MKDSIYFISPLKIYIFFTTLYGFISLKKYKFNNLCIILILIINFFTEIINSVFVYKHMNIGFLTTIDVIITHALWLLLLLENDVKNKKTSIIIMLVFLFFIIINIVFIEGIAFNFNIFILSSLLYIVIFIVRSFRKLEKEIFDYFLSLDYFLLCSPLFYFFGLSFIFAFKSTKLANVHVFSDLKLYKFIAYFVNIIYYSFINIYIYRENKLKRAR